MSAVFGNIYDEERLHAELNEAFVELDAILKNHAGPFAANCVIGSPHRQVNDVDEFTKDGIQILRNMIVSEDACARFATRMVRFIGIAVDKRCYDGTTTSMLLFCRLAIQAISKIDMGIGDFERYHWWNEFQRLMQVCLTEIERFKITDDDILERAQAMGIPTSIEDVRAAIAFHMAMISSKGDADLSEKIAKIIRSAPKKIHGMFREHPLAVETEERYILKRQEYDISVSANLGNLRDYNHLNDSQWLSEDTVIFATADEIIPGSWESSFLLSFISTLPKYRQDLSPTFNTEFGWEHYHNNTRRLIILSPLFNDSELLMQINLFNKDHPNIKISNFNYHVFPKVKTSFDKTLHYMAGVPRFKDVMNEDVSQCLIGLNAAPIKAHLLGNTLAISNLYAKDGEVYHPLYRNPDTFEKYTQFVKETEELIDFVTANITNPALEKEELSYLVSLYRSLTCQEIYDIDIGGSIHDQYANRTVYEDAIGAALAAINEGVVLSGYAHMAKHFSTNESDSELGKRIALILVSIVADTMRASTFEINELINEDLQDKWSYIVADPKVYLSGYGQDPYVFAKHLDAATLQEFLERKDKTPVLLQAWSGYNEQFKRFRDILPKLANTTNLADMRIKHADDVR